MNEHVIIIYTCYYYLHATTHLTGCGVHFIKVSQGIGSMYCLMKHVLICKCIIKYSVNTEMPSTILEELSLTANDSFPFSNGLLSSL